MGQLRVQGTRWALRPAGLANTDRNPSGTYRYRWYKYNTTGDYRFRSCGGRTTGAYCVSDLHRDRNDPGRGKHQWVRAAGLSAVHRHPAGPTAAAGTNTTQLATTAFVASYAVPVLGAQQSPTAGATNITFTGIPSWAKRVTLSWSGLTMASGYANLRLGTSSGLKTSGYGTAPSTNYTWLKSIGGGENIYNYTDLGVYYFVGIYTGSGNVSIVKMSSTAWMISGMCLMPGASYVIGYQAYQVLASDLTQIALVGDGSATFSAGGNINILYE